MNVDAQDMALASLLKVAKDVASDLPEDLFNKAYAIQRKHQFDRDRSVSLQEMQRLVEEFVRRGEEDPLRPGAKK